MKFMEYHLTWMRQMACGVRKYRAKQYIMTVASRNPAASVLARVGSGTFLYD